MRKIVVFISVLCAILCIGYTVYATGAASGTCGDNLTWVLDSDGVLTISGEGEMSNWTYQEKPPWDATAVKSVIVESGVTSIGQRAFYDCDYLESVQLNEGLKYIYGYAFPALEEIEIPASVIEMNGNLFASSTKLIVMKNSYAEVYAKMMGCQFEIKGEVPIKEVYVKTTDELIAAIDSNTVITLADGIYALEKSVSAKDQTDFIDGIMITKVINLTIKAENPGMAEILSLKKRSSETHNVSTLYISNVHNVTFEGIRIGCSKVFNAGGTEIKRDEATLLGDWDSSDIYKYDGVTIGPGKLGDAYDYESSIFGESDSVYMNNSINFINCDIFGSGKGISCTEGILTFKDSIIRDNVCSAIYAGSGSSVNIENTLISSNGSYEESISEYCVEVNGKLTMNNCSFFNNSNPQMYYAEETDLGENITETDNVWNEENPMAYGITKNGITWQVKNVDNVTTLRLGYPIERNGITIESEKGAVYPYTIHSLPWGVYSYTSVDLSDGIVYNDNLKRGSIGKDVDWELDLSSGKLIISGTGDMTEDYNSGFYKWNGIITDIEIADTVEGIYSNYIIDTAYGSNEENIVDGALYVGNHLIKVYDASGVFKVREGTRTIAEDAFYNTNVTEIVVPEGVVGFGVLEKLGISQHLSGVFLGCKNLKSLKLPSSIKNIDNSFVLNCSVADIYYGGTISQWENLKKGKDSEVDFCNIHCIDGVIAAQNVTYEKNDETITITACNDRLKEIVVPAEIDGCPVTKIYDSVFKNHTWLESLILSEGITEIPTINGCTALKKLVVPTTVKEIDYDTFSGCTSLEDITLPRGLDIRSWYLENTAFYRNKNNYKNGMLVLCGYLLGVNEEVSSTLVIGEPIHSICCDMSGNNTIREVVIENGINCEKLYFSDCKNLQKITLPSDLSVAEDYIANVSGCSSLTEILISEENPNYVSLDGVLYSKDMTELVLAPAGRENLIVAEGCKKIKEYALSGAIVSRLTLPATLTEIEECATDNMKKLERIDFTGTKVQWEEIVIGDYGNDAVTNASIYGEYFSIIVEPLEFTISSDGTYAILSGCKTYAKEITIPAQYNGVPVKVIDAYYFGDSFYQTDYLECINVEAESEYFSSVDGILFSKDKKTLVRYPAGKKGDEYTIPEGITSVAMGAFSGCKNLKKITTAQTMKVIPESFAQYCELLTEVVMTDSITEIGKSAFRACENLSFIKWPASLEKIAYCAFYATGLTEVVIPDSVTVIEESAFAGNDNLKKITFGKGITFIPERVCSSCPYLESIYIKGDITEFFYERNYYVGDITPFDDCPSLKYIYYTGTPEMWENIKNVSLSIPYSVTVFYNSNGISDETKIVSAQIFNKTDSYIEVEVDVELLDDGIVVVAGYGNNGKLASVADDFAKKTENDTLIYELAIEENINNIKVFAWKGATPLCNSVAIEIE